MRRSSKKVNPTAKFLREEWYFPLNLKGEEKKQPYVKVFYECLKTGKTLMFIQRNQHPAPRGNAQGS